jgi:tripartite-type tricarboxylate transporter receptor subunit TctC
LRQRFSGEAAIPSPITPEEFAAVINRDLAMWKKVVISANIKPE